MNIKLFVVSLIRFESRAIQLCKSLLLSQLGDYDPGIGEECRKEEWYEVQDEIIKEEISLIKKYLEKYPEEINNILLS